MLTDAFLFCWPYLKELLLCGGATIWVISLILFCLSGLGLLLDFSSSYSFLRKEARPSLRQVLKRAFLDNIGENIPLYTFVASLVLGAITYWISHEETWTAWHLLVRFVRWLI